MTVSNPIVAWEILQALSGQAQRRVVGRLAPLAAICFALVAALGLGVCYLGFAAPPSTPLGPDTQALFEMMRSGEGEVAVQCVAAAAAVRGGWGPAPGDEIVYDPDLPRQARGGTPVVDEFPLECANLRLEHDREECVQDFLAEERQVLFGPSMFANPGQAGDSVPRPALDDLLSTYIEEVGHSWQEYLYETEGRGYGARTRAFSQEEARRGGHGREYQVKRYILSLDGNWLALSDQQRHELQAAICDEEGYASPAWTPLLPYPANQGYPVPSYGPPPGWPNPDGWPVTTPTMEEYERFCASAGFSQDPR